MAKTTQGSAMSFASGDRSNRADSHFRRRTTKTEFRLSREHLWTIFGPLLYLRMNFTILRLIPRTLRRDSEREDWRRIPRKGGGGGIITNREKEVSEEDTWLSWNKKPWIWFWLRFEVQRRFARFSDAYNLKMRFSLSSCKDIASLLFRDW